jgi:MinD-like ATPase involved in chromosome partitioning or flagellar assembly
MASPSPETAVPAWPVADATVHADGTASLTIHGAERPLTAADPGAARAELVRLVRDELAAELGRPVRLRTLDPDGTEGLLAVAPDGAVTELATGRARHDHHVSPTPAAPAVPERPSAPLRVADDASSGPHPSAPREEEGVDAAAPGELDGTRAPRPIRRSEVHHRQPGLAQRAWAWVTGELLVSKAERAERAEDARLAQLVGASHANVIPFVGPRGGAGKTTAARTVGGILASAKVGSVVLFDADQHYGPAADLVPDAQRSTKTIIDLLSDFGGQPAPPPPQLRPYLSRFDDGLLLLAAPTKRADMKRLAEDLELYAEALRLLEGIEVLLMDTAGGIGELQEWALARADQAVVLCPPDYMAANNIAKVLTDPDLRLPERTTLVLNDTRPEGGGDLAAIEHHFARHSFEARIRVPYDHTLRLSLDQATYQLGALPLKTRLPLKRLAATIGEGLR